MPSTVLPGMPYPAARSEMRSVAKPFFTLRLIAYWLFSHTKTTGSLQMAAIWKLPVVFLCENNQYGMSMSVKKATAVENISDRASAYGMPGVTVSGSDLDEVHEATATALERARAGEGPTLLEAITYRYLGHSKSDANLYRTREEISTWRKRDPIERFAAVLEDEGALKEGEWRDLEERVKGRIEEAFDRAARSPDPEPESALEDVYA